ncbi:MAG: hypothetical protein Q8L86_13245 [Vicinamibacterales bacterium]|nr:hypothetical protein [Vicinamibacterales bacterium]
MVRVSTVGVVLGLLLSSAGGVAAQPLTCDPAQLSPASYRLATDAQALNVTRPRTDWWEGFDATLSAHTEALADLNEAALTLAERALDLDPRNLPARAILARQLIVLGEDGDRARDEIRRVFDAGGALVWSATLYDVDGRRFFLTAFDREGIHVYRFEETAFAHLPAPPRLRRDPPPDFPDADATVFWRAWGGCLDGLRPVASVPWSDVHEIKAGNHVLYFKFRSPVEVVADGGKRKTLREFKVALHGAMGTVDLFYRPSIYPSFGRPYMVPSRGVGIGPTMYQDRVRRTLAAIVDPEGRIKLPKASRGAGW